MRISEVHSAMRECGTLPTGPLTDPRTGQRIMRNRGVRREWRNHKHMEALLRASVTEHNKTRAHRLNKCYCGKGPISA